MHSRKIQRSRINQMPGLELRNRQLPRVGMSLPLTGMEHSAGEKPHDCSHPSVTRSTCQATGSKPHCPGRKQNCGLLPGAEEQRKAQCSEKLQPRSKPNDTWKRKRCVLCPRPECPKEVWINDTYSSPAPFTVFPSACVSVCFSALLVLCFILF